MSVHNVIKELEKADAAGYDPAINMAGTTPTFQAVQVDDKVQAGGVTGPYMDATELRYDSIRGNTNINGPNFTNGHLSTAADKCFGYGTGAGGAVTQATDATTTVVLSKPCGQITTVALTTAAAAEEEFQLTNTLLAATDTLALSTTYAGAGTPIVSTKGMAAGSCKIVITNVHAANALNAVMVINFAVVKAVAA